MRAGIILCFAACIFIANAQLWDADLSREELQQREIELFEQNIEYNSEDLYLNEDGTQATPAEVTA